MEGILEEIPKVRNQKINVGRSPWKNKHIPAGIDEGIWEENPIAEGGSEETPTGIRNKIHGRICDGISAILEKEPGKNLSRKLMSEEIPGGAYEGIPVYINEGIAVGINVELCNRMPENISESISGEI